jgi:hypothetical protein
MNGTVAMNDPAVAGLLGVLGLLVGSFLNVCIYRLPRRETILWGRSHCPGCGRQIRAWENVPVISWLWLRGRCAGCRAPISLQYPLVELATGLVFAVTAWLVGPTLLLIAIFVALARRAGSPPSNSSRDRNSGDSANIGAAYSTSIVVAICWYRAVSGRCG